MARYIKPSCRLCRREGGKLFLKGQRCGTPKCSFERRSVAPGQHGAGRHAKLSNYGKQLREKQKVKRIYGILEKQFRIYFKKAAKERGITGDTLLQLLERRLDNVLFRLAFASSRPQARQFVMHGHVAINGRKVDIPSYIVKEKDSIEIRGKEEFIKSMQKLAEELEGMAVPKWLKRGEKNLKGEVIALPKRDDTTFPIQEQLIVELYSK
ncbi:MAG: 30S ribosomal protein S4 [Candidatus Omnitrophica bacterium CG1_02_49_10]|nr:MAG: 30S ribosomal protein S4 [Candidatus Omnitrophica bacterium CG1_02_49_10]